VYICPRCDEKAFLIKWCSGQDSHEDEENYCENKLPGTECICPSCIWKRIPETNDDDHMYEATMSTMLDFHFTMDIHEMSMIQQSNQCSYCLGVRDIGLIHMSEAFERICNCFSL
jgi:hypothetical protein